MSKKDNQLIKDIIEEEGLGYAIQHYISSKSIKDPKLAKLWIAAEEAMSKIIDYLKISL